jgi:hypothetical protein
MARWPRRRTLVVQLALLLSLVAGLVLVGRSPGYTGYHVDLTSASAWLPSSQVGQIALVDGTTAQVTAKKVVAPPRHTLGLVQRNQDAYVVDRVSGDLSRVDGAAYGLTKHPQVNGKNGGQDVDLYAGTKALYVYDRARGVLTVSDPTSLRTTSQKSLPRAPEANGAVLDPSGALWVLDGRSGDLLRYEGTRSTLVRHDLVSSGRSAALLLAQGRPVVVDFGGKDPGAWLVGQNGDPQQRNCLRVQDGDRLELAGATSRHTVLAAVNGRGVLVWTDLDSRQNCDSTATVGSPTDRLGTPVEAGGRAFVPNFTESLVYVIDLATGRQIAAPKLPFTRDHQFDLLSVGDYVFYNDPTSEQAGVIRLDGSLRSTAKYDPRRPDAGLGSPQKPRSTPKPGPKATQPKTVPPTSEPTPGRTAASGGASPPTGNNGQKALGVLQVGVTPPAKPYPGQSFGFVAMTTAGHSLRQASWDFGDGTTGSGVTTRHAYARAGRYLVTATGQLTAGGFAVATAHVQVVPAGAPVPTLHIEVSKPAPLVGQREQLSAVVTGLATPSYFWTITNTDQNTSAFLGTGRTASYTLPSKGNYLVTLLVDGFQATRAIPVGNPPPTIDSVTCGHDGGDWVGSAYHCLVNAASSSIVSWAWTVAVDGSVVHTETSTNAELSFTPSVAGDYLVQVIGTDDVGRTTLVTPAPGFHVAPEPDPGGGNISVSPDPASNDLSVTTPVAFTFTAWFDPSLWAYFASVGWAPRWTVTNPDGSTSTPAVNRIDAAQVQFTFGQTFATQGNYVVEFAYVQNGSYVEVADHTTVHIGPPTARVHVTIVDPAGLTDGGGSVYAGAAQICPGDCTISVQQGESLTFKAKEGSRTFFASWSGSCASSTSCRVTPADDTPIELTATFDAAQVVSATLVGGTYCSTSAAAAAVVDREGPSARSTTDALPQEPTTSTDTTTTTTTTTTTSSTTSSTTTTDSSTSSTTSSTTSRPTCHERYYGGVITLLTDPGHPQCAVPVGTDTEIHCNPFKVRSGTAATFKVTTSGGATIQWPPGCVPSGDRCTITPTADVDLVFKFKHTGGGTTSISAVAWTSGLLAPSNLTLAALLFLLLGSLGGLVQVHLRHERGRHA